ncbi:MAG: type II toxin-antitoxin system VapC family toxin [Chloroflexi bacterium]|nr:type II toxin-antitoxin system VapC family toxin [Chloroflexota bacterium]
MRTAVLDASALLALLNSEPGSEQIAQALINGATISTINFSEVVAKLSEIGMPEAEIHETLDFLGLEISAFDSSCAYQAGLLRPITKHLGLSFGDRSCLALAHDLKLPAFTTDKAWKNLSLDITIQVIH